MIDTQARHDASKGGPKSRLDRWCKGFILLALAGLVSVFCFNAARHDARVGYDADAHLLYADTLAHGRLPSPDDTLEFHSAPLSYVPTALLIAFGCDRLDAAKTTQWLQVVYGALLLIHVVWLLGLLGISKLTTLASLVLIGCASAWWRSFAFARPEPMLAMLVVAAVYHTAHLLTRRPERWRLGLAAVLWGLAPLARQWGVFAMLGAFPVILFYTCRGRLNWRQFGICALVCFCLAAPFYIVQTVRFRTLTPFNRDIQTRAALDWSWNPLEAARHPTAPELVGRPTDIFYADLFGDYGMYFITFGRSNDGRWLSGSKLIEGLQAQTVKRTNIKQTRRYLWYPLTSSVVVTVLLLIGMAYTLGLTIRRALYPAGEDDAALGLIVSVALASAAGYAWFIATYTHAGGDTDTVKPTYILHAWPLCACLLAVFIQRLARRWRVHSWFYLLVVLTTFVINWQTFFTRYYR